MDNPDNISHEQLIGTFLDGELNDSDREYVESLLRESAELRQLLSDFQALRTNLRSLPRHTLDDQFAKRVLDRIESEPIDPENGKVDTVHRGARSAGPERNTLHRNRIAWRMAAIGITSLAASIVALLYVPSMFAPREVAGVLESAEKNQAVPKPDGDEPTTAEPTNGEPSDGEAAAKGAVLFDSMNAFGRDDESELELNRRIGPRQPEAANRSQPSPPVARSSGMDRTDHEDQRLGQATRPRESLELRGGRSATREMLDQVEDALPEATIDLALDQDHTTAGAELDVDERQNAATFESSTDVATYVVSASDIDAGQLEAVVEAVLVKQQVQSDKVETESTRQLGLPAVELHEEESLTQLGRGLNERLGEAGQLVLVEASPNQIAAIVNDLNSDDRINVISEGLTDQLATQASSLYFSQPGARIVESFNVQPRSRATQENAPADATQRLQKDRSVEAGTATSSARERVAPQLQQATQPRNRAESASTEKSDHGTAVADARRKEAKPTERLEVRSAQPSVEGGGLGGFGVGLAGESPRPTGRAYWGIPQRGTSRDSVGRYALSEIESEPRQEPHGRVRASNRPAVQAPRDALRRGVDGVNQSNLERTNFVRALFRLEVAGKSPTAGAAKSP